MIAFSIFIQVFFTPDDKAAQMVAKKKIMIFYLTSVFRLQNVLLKPGDNLLLAFWHSLI